MATRPDRPALRARYDRRQRDVVEHAARVFAARGYDQTSISELALELGVSTGSLYHHFSGKEELLAGICDELLDPLLAAVEALVTVDLDPAQELRELVRVWVAHVVEHRDHMLVFQQERHVIERGDRWRGIRASRKAFERIVEDRLGRLLRAGAAAYDDERLALSALLGMVNHTAQWYRPRGRLQPEQIADGYVDLLLA